MAGNVLEFTDQNFQTEVLESDQPVVVDFWAPWCGPCRMLTPTIEELANDSQGQVRVGQVNTDVAVPAVGRTDENPKTASAQQVMSIPTVMIFKNGQLVERIVGVTPKDRFVAALQNHVSVS